MNHYGSQAMAHWQRWLPHRYSQIPNPPTFFTELGQEVAAQIAELSTQLAGADLPGETYLEKVGRLNAARMQAEELVLRELVLLEPEPGADPDQDPDQSEEQTGAEQTPDSDWIPLVEDPSSPYWAQLQERDVSEELGR